MKREDPPDALDIVAFVLFLLMAGMFWLALAHP
jgi:hypothetical protein